VHIESRLGQEPRIEVSIISMAAPNTLFAIINVSDPADLRAKMLSIPPWVSLELQDGQWLLVAPNATTTQEVSEKLGFSGSGPNTGIVMRVENYFGRNYQTVWEWITTKQGAALGIATPA
jgi:hypothetical protein